jgi:hypothetical protein
VLVTKELIPARQFFILRENTGDRAPFGGHVGNSQTFIDREVLYTFPDEFDGAIEDFVVVEVSSKRDNDVLSSDTGRQLPLQFDLDDFGNLPPEFAGCPDTSSVGSDDGSTQAANATIMVRMTVTSHYHLSWPCITLLYHDLVANTSSCGVEVDSVLLGKLFNLAVLGKIRFRFVLYIVVEGKHWLFSV